ncbi:MAG TPA: ABC transporter permease, partial [Massilibacterium sp.]|nr:ABC transporter permease [Massilibacterium sp.]
MIKRMILQRFLQMIVVLLLLSFVTFLLMRLAPGDPVKELLRADEMTVTIEEEQQLREKLGFDQPLLVQYGHWFFNVLRFDFGQSYISNESVITEIINHLPATIIVTIGSLIVMIMISV